MFLQCQRLDAKHSILLVQYEKGLDRLIMARISRGKFSDGKTKK